MILLDTNVISELMRTAPEPAALAYGEIMAWRRSIGRPMAILEGQIAAIARVRGCAIATRNTADFEQVASDLTNPWTAS